MLSYAFECKSFSERSLRIKFISYFHDIYIYSGPCNSGSGPCNKNCAYCDHLRRTEADTFKSVKTGSVYKIRQNITCESKDIIYIISCRRHNLQGVGCTTDLKGRLSNYKSHHKKKYISCGITEHFLEDGHDFEADFEFLPIVKLLNPPSNIVKRRERLEEFELYWQENLVTYEPYGMNKKTEIEKARQKVKNRLKKKRTVRS